MTTEPTTPPLFDAMTATTAEVRTELARIRRDMMRQAGERAIARTQDRCEKRWPDLKKEAK